MARIDCPCRIGLLPAALDWELLVCCAWMECLLDRFSLGRRVLFAESYFLWSFSKILWSWPLGCSTVHQKYAQLEAMSFTTRGGRGTLPLTSRVQVKSKSEYWYYVF